jgi:hypothetical protein
MTDSHNIPPQSMELLQPAIERGAWMFRPRSSLPLKLRTGLQRLRIARQHRKIAAKHRRSMLMKTIALSLLVLGLLSVQVSEADAAACAAGPHRAGCVGPLAR